MLRTIQNISESQLNEMRERYYEIRHRVYHEATTHEGLTPADQQLNQQKFRSRVAEICDAANLDLYRPATQAARTNLWHHLWTKIKYAGIRAQNATNEIHSIQSIFDDYSSFSNADWDIEIDSNRTTRATQLVRGGSQIYHFINRTGAFSNLPTNGKLSKLSMIINVARLFHEYCLANPNVEPLKFVKGDFNENEIWQIHQSMMDRGYRADLTTCHFLMDIGFNVVKPDVVLSRLFLEWGWLHAAIPSLPRDVTQDDLVNKGKHKARYSYTKQEIYRPIIDLSRQIVSNLDRQKLILSTGWVTSNPLREFDLFIVKAGQLPEDDLGIVKTLYPSDRYKSKKTRRQGSKAC